MPSKTPAPAHPTRDEVWRLLRTATEPVSITALADELGVHANTIRFHLHTLVDNGRVERVEPAHRVPGRPAQLFRAVPGMDPAGPRHYRLLADVLAADLAARPDAARRATEAGRNWGRRQAPGAGDPDPTGGLVRILDDLGFAPEPATGPTIRLRHCPFGELAAQRGDVVCGIHLGLMRGATENLDITVDKLEAFVEPDLCLVHLTTGPR